MQTVSPELIEHVRTALGHLYDYAYLQNHPLAVALAGRQSLDEVTRAQKLRRTLLEAIESLLPKPYAADHAEATRAYAILAYRYVDGLTVAEITQKLALSRRQMYREHAKGLEAVASMISQKLQSAALPDPAVIEPSSVSSERLHIARTEVDLLSRTAHASQVDVHHLMDELRSMLSARMQQLGVRVTLAGQREWPPVIVDRTLVRQALLNLLSNAMDAVAGRGHLAISVEEQQADLVVHISEEASPDRTLTGPINVRREGIGLAIAERLIETQGGRLDLHRHATMWQADVYLPVANAPTVLIVDDNEELVDLFQRYLGGHRLTVVCATNGTEAVARAVAVQAQAILLDIMMPNLDGWDVLQQLKTDPQTAAIPVIVCSVLREADLALSLGASDFVTKPVSQAALLEVLRRWLGTLQPVV